MSANKDEAGVFEGDFVEVLGEKYLAYALSTIMSRSLPDVRDGLKPVHRRLLYAMLMLNLNPDQAYKKCARVVGDVIGKYHPHGDVAVYETLVRLAQDFSLRYPLIEGQGNFGSIDGDNAAAMRYTESKLSLLATYLMSDINKNTVDFKATYDDSDEEPALMPASFPNILANGAEGIAVGMATSIPPHNLDELSLAMIHLIDNPEATVRDLFEFIEGPDFPTGGIVVETRENIISTYETGRGSVRLRAKYEIENFAHGLYQIIITEIPYQVQKSKLIEHIANLLKDKKIPLVGNIRDESTEVIRLIIEPKNRLCDPKMVMESLYKQSDLEIRFNYNMNVLGSSGLPAVMNIKQILVEFLNHRLQVITRRAKYNLDKINQRLEILEGLKVVYLNLDEIIRIVRDEDDPKEVLKKTYNLTENQADAILNIRLRSLRKLEEQAIIAEHKSLCDEKDSLLAMLADKAKCYALIKLEIKEIIKLFGKKTKLGERRTLITEPEEFKTEVRIEAFVEREPITIVCSKQGWIRSVKGQIDDLNSIKFREGDEYKTSFKAYTTDYILVATKFGKFYTIFADNLSKGKGTGEPISMIVDMAQDDEVLDLFPYRSDQKIILIASNGKGFIVNQNDVYAQTKNGKHIMSLAEGSDCLKALVIDESKNMLALITSNRKLLVIKLEEVPQLKKGQGVTLVKFKEGKLNDAQVFNDAEGFSWNNNKEIKNQKNYEPWLGKRASSGKLPPFGFIKTNMF